RNSDRGLSASVVFLLSDARWIRSGRARVCEEGARPNPSVNPGEERVAGWIEVGCERRSNIRRSRFNDSNSRAPHCLAGRAQRSTRGGGAPALQLAPECPFGPARRG